MRGFQVRGETVRGDEGPAAAPVYVPGRARPGHGVRPPLLAGPPCVVCGARVIAMGRRRICARCGLLTGGPEER
jgi:hypothetical protein